jgi:DNA-binding response OmpR family regulator
MMRMKRVLIAADDAHTAAWMRSGLDALGVTITDARPNEVAMVVGAEEIDLVVMDGGREPDVLAQTLERSVASGAVTRLLLVVEPGALAKFRLPVRLHADFVVRGGTADELAARARNLLWPGEEVASNELIRIDDLVVNLATYQAYWQGTPIDFTYLEYALFTFLVTHPNRAYSREILLRRVWGSDYYGGSRTVDVHIRRVRAKLPSELGHRLETVRNVGYLWAS